MTQKLVNLKRNLLIMIMTNIQRELNTLATNVVNTKITQANLVTKTNFDNEVSSLDSKIAANKTEYESIENKLATRAKKPFSKSRLRYFVFSCYN